MTNHPEWKPEMVDILPDVPTGTNPIINNGTAINAKSKNAERALMVLDLLSQDRDYFDLSVYGVKGTDWDAEGDDDITMLPDVPDPFGGFGMGWNLNLPRISKDSAFNYLSMLEGFDQNHYTAELSLMSFDDTNVKNEIATVSAVRSKYASVLEFGFADDVEATYAEYRSELKKAGLDAIQEEYKRQAEEFLKQ
ncbi:DUF3502 domain-containing protein [Lachnotalea sp. AF33-28]|jgi:putative aldouronate transport system substrate-binding protein|uniref:DUF3502 domain-containing protein n=1 Tax=Lachnotalea sp. AF33-28 TaxID=2292046 RepID=UPI000E54A6D6|nr:DUF3502 domain-containing protein [Lachnotalea sp. AF33-28]RHP36459.1 DUF3502 domain-containing protein [Lachnotalea sp. AF33-28]